MSDSYVHVGKIHSPQGVRGDIFVYIFSGEAAWMDQWDKLYVSKDKEKVPSETFEILNVKFHRKQKKPGFVLKLKECPDRNKAEEITGLKVYIPESFLVSEEGEGIYLREVLNFRVIDKERGDIGEVVGFMDNGMQDLLIIKNSEGTKFEVPFVEPIHLETLMDKKEIHVEVPFGLVPGEEL